MKHETSLALHAYWAGCGGEAGVLASAIRAEELKSILPALFLLDGDASVGFRFQFCGAAIMSRYGRDLTASAFLTLWTPSDRELLVRELRAGSSGIVMGVLGETAGGGFTFFEMVVLPLSSASGGTGAIGSMVRVGGHDEINRIRARIVGQSVRSLRFLSGTNAMLTRRFAGAPRLSHRAACEMRRRYGHLTVVQGGRSDSVTNLPLTDP